MGYRAGRAVEWKPNGSEGSPRMLVKAGVHDDGGMECKDGRGILRTASGHSRKLGKWESEVGEGGKGRRPMY
jgi:hypothetical protein